MEKEEFQNFILEKYQEVGRDFPWRTTDNKLHALVAEILLQQTTSKQVEKGYRKFTEKYKTPEDVLEADKKELESIFSYLGLYKRVDYIISVAEFLASEKEITQENLLEVKGVGKYTANAFLCFNENKRYPIVDVNVMKVFEKHFKIDDNSPPRRNEEAWDLAWELLPRKNYRDYNLGLLDYGNLL